MIDMNIARDLLTKAADLQGYKCVMHKSKCYMAKGDLRVKLTLKEDKRDGVKVLLGGRKLSRENEKAYFNQALIILENA